MRRSLLALMTLASVSLVGCFATSAEHGRVLPGGPDDPWVTVEAGNVQFRGGRFFARYAVDRATQTCWMIVGGGLGQMDCCAARRVGALRDVITWASDATCAPPQPAFQPPLPPPAPALPPPSSNTP